MNPLDSIDGAIAASGNRRNVLVVQMSAYKERPLLSIRRWYIDQKTQEWRPTKKGVSVSQKGYDFLKGVFEAENPKIDKWFEANAEDISAVEEGLQSESYAKIVGDFSLQVVLKEWRGPEMARVSVSGSMQILEINTGHKVGATIAELIEEVGLGRPTSREKKMLSTMLFLVASLERMPLMFEGRQVWPAEELFDAIRWNLGILMKAFEKCEKIDYVL